MIRQQRGYGFCGMLPCMRKLADSAGRAVAGAGHLAVWAALYQCGALALAGTTAGLRVGVWAYLGVGLVAMSTYLKDRVKLRREHWDPADVLAHPSRAVFLRSRVGWIRAAMVVALLGGVVCLWFVHPALVLLGPGAWCGVVWYGRPRVGGGRRPKDVIVIKNTIVAGAIGGMVCVVAGVSDGGWAEWGGSRWFWGLLIGAAVFAQVFCDAVLCDLGDRCADQAYGTRTVVVVYGIRSAWVVALIAQGVASGLVLSGGLIGGVAFTPSLIWGIGGVLFWIITRKAPDRVTRDFTDMKLGLLGAAVLVISCCG